VLRGFHVFAFTFVFVAERFTAPEALRAPADLFRRGNGPALRRATHVDRSIPVARSVGRSVGRYYAPGGPAGYIKTFGRVRAGKGRPGPLRPRVVLTPSASDEGRATSA